MSLTLADAVRDSFPPGMYRVIAMVERLDVGYALFDTNPTGQPYFYGVEYRRTDTGWTEGQSGNGPGWFGGAPDTRVGGMTAWDDAPPGADRVRVKFQGQTYEEPVVDGAYFLVWWDVPVSEDWPVLSAVRINGQWQDSVGDWRTPWAPGSGAA